MDKQNELKRIIEKVQINYLILNMREYAKLTTDERQKLLLELKKQNAKLIKNGVVKMNEKKIKLKKPKYILWKLPIQMYDKSYSNNDIKFYTIVWSKIDKMLTEKSPIKKLLIEFDTLDIDVDNIDRVEIIFKNHTKIVKKFN